MTRTKQQIGLFTLLLTADQLSKWWIEQQLPFFHQVIIDGYFNLVKAHNFGVAFSMFADWSHEWRTALLLIVTITISIGLCVWWWREHKRPGIESWLLILILVGAVGNIWDRITLGYVVDFVDWYISINGHTYHWPAFNIADACIFIAMVLLLIQSFKQR